MSVQAHKHISMLKDLYMETKKDRYNKKKSLKCYLDLGNDTVMLPLRYGIDKGVIADECEERYATTSAVFTGKLRDKQPLWYKHIVSTLADTRTCFLSSNCGSGKTIMTIKAIVASGMRAIVFFHIKGNRGQWEKEIASFSTLSTCILANFNTKKKGVPEADVYLAMKSDVKYMSQTFIDSVGFLAVDEAKLQCSQQYVNAFLHFRPRYAMALSADYTREDGFHVMIDHIFGKERILVLDKRPFDIIRINTIFKPVLKSTKGMDWNDVTEQMSVNKERNAYLASEIIVDLDAGHKIIALSKRVKQLEALHELLKDTKYKIGKYWGDSEGYENCDVLLAGVKKGGVGFDSKSSCSQVFDGKPFDTVHLLSSMKEVQQYVGRARADVVTVKDYVDDMGTFKKHYDIRLEWYKTLVNAKYTEKFMRMVI